MLSTTLESHHTRFCRQRGRTSYHATPRRLTTWPPDWRAAIKADAKEVIIITGDSDFAQLVNGPVKIHDINKSCLLEKQGLFDPKIALLQNTRRRQS
jgi:hypothetical protein